jgi:hypothetical protein
MRTNGTLGSYRRDALQEGSADALACLRVPRDKACGVFFLITVHFLWLSLVFLLGIASLIYVDRRWKQ